MVVVTYTNIWDFEPKEDTDEQSDAIFFKDTFLWLQNEMVIKTSK